MSIMRWRPMRDLTSTREEMRHLFDDFLTGWPWLERGRDLLDSEWTPSVDVAETEEDVIVTAELPGVRPEDVDLTIANDILTIRGEKKEEEEADKERRHRVERCYGNFQSSISLPTGVQEDKVEACYKDGVLRVSIPKGEKVKPKQIKISVE